MIDFKLNPDEIRMLDMFREYGTAWVEMADMSEHGRDCVDMLVLSGLVERGRSRCVPVEARYWLNEWRLTPEGAEILADQEIAHCAGSSVNNQESLFS